MHDNAASPWADYWILGIYLDEGSSGFDISHNVSKNSPTEIACNSCGSYTKSDNDGQSATTIANAGIEEPYRGIKNNANIPLPVFSNGSAGLLDGPAERGTFGISAIPDGNRLRVSASSHGAGADLPGTLRVYDQRGALVSSHALEPSPSGTWSVDIGAHPAGRYLAVLDSDKSRHIAQFVRMR
jgi:hypothetical protein